jgi:hypothetical protein
LSSVAPKRGQAPGMYEIARTRMNTRPNASGSAEISLREGSQ